MGHGLFCREDGLHAMQLATVIAIDKPLPCRRGNSQKQTYDGTMTPAIHPAAHPTRRTVNFRLLAFFSALGLSADALTKTSPEVLLAHDAPAGLDPAGYWVSEKYDGVRALWDGKTLRFRSGRTVSAPPWFIAKLPATPLDGELWMGRGTFDVLSGAVRRTQPLDAEWQKLKYMVFELPKAEGTSTTFTQRIWQMQAIVKTAGWAQLQAVEQTEVANHAALQARLKAVIAAGGEGLVLHRASAPVTSGRSDVLLKLKAVQDAEAEVVGHVPGKGKFEGMLGALEVLTTSGQRFKLGTGLSDAQRHNPPAIGSTVTYTYRDVTPSGKPRFASFLRVHEEG
jgi:DNA ligase 1